MVDVLHRPHKEGLGPAYLAGFRQALADGAELVLEMDCDFSHDPADVPRLIAAAAGADLVLGSRYVQGGAVANWGFVRRCDLARRVDLRAPAPDAGPRPDRRLQVLPARGARGDRPRRDPLGGYAFQIETTYRALRAGFRVVEIPIRFVDREEGHSKMSRAIVLEAIWKVPLLRLAGAARPAVASPPCSS